MASYRSDPAALAALFQGDRVHRDVYISDEIFALECERLFARAWIFAGHESQIPKTGDYLTLESAGVPLIVVRAAQGAIHALVNRCAHKGAAVLADAMGNTGRAFRCPYHGWSYRLDGSILGIPMRAAYDGTALMACESGKGLQTVAAASHRGFIFVRLAAEGPSLAEYFGDSLFLIDQMVERSPAGALEFVGPCMRNTIRCNWKIYLENINDSLHVFAAHEAAAIGARKAWGTKPPDAPKPMAIEQLLPFTFSNEFMDEMGGRVLPNGHSVIGTTQSSHSVYAAIPGYAEAMEKAYGTEKARKLLAFSPQNMILYPTLAMKTAPQVLRVLRPLAADRTVVEGWAFRAKGAPDALLEQSLTYSRIAFSPLSLVALDDVQVFETVQKALHASGNEWVSLHRGYTPDETASADGLVNGTNEILMRNQFRAWADMMGAGGEARA
jgi:phenylpropionate dioxygenase-like ring-hydroxylating dioxygenase large terminal subunit